MPKNILVSNSGSYQPISASFDNNGALSSSVRLTINTASYVGQSGLMQIFNGQLIPVPLTSSAEYNPDGAIKVPQYSGSALSYNSAVGFGPHRLETPQFSGDISGDLTNGIKVRNLSNITGGILSSMYGGTSNTSYTINSLVTTSGSGPVYGETNKVVAVVDNQGTWGLADSNILNPPEPLLTGTLVYLYTGSVGASNTFIWQKPQGCKIVRVICQGGGGGGGGGELYFGFSTFTVYGGVGGGGGGYSEVVLNSFSLPEQVIITAGAGGSGAAPPPTNGRSYGTNGQSSSFGNIIYSTGGTAAGVDRTITNGIGYSNNGQSISVSYICGVKGGNGGNTIRTSANGSGTNGNSVLNAIGGIGGYGSPSRNVNGETASDPISIYILLAKTLFINNQLSNDIPKLICGGGGGGGAANKTVATPATYAGNGSSATFGSGGGGGGAMQGVEGSIGSSGAGGNGGVGYVLIICS